MATRLALVAAVLMLVAGVRPASAACVDDGQGPCYRYWQMDAVLVGEVTDKVLLESDGLDETYQIRVAITDAFRGVAAGDPPVVMYGRDGECGLGVEVGQRVFFYARRRKDGTLWATSYSRAFDEADEDLAYARLASTRSAPAMVYGEVLQRESADDDADSFTSLAGVGVRVWRDDFDVTTSTDEEGRYSVHLPGPGTYRVDVIAPGGLAKRYAADDRFTLANAQDCWRVDFQLTTNGRIRGVVVDGATGRPIPNLVIEAEDGIEAARTDSRGAFDIGPLSAGVYAIEARTGGEFDRVLAEAVRVVRGRATSVRLVADDLPQVLVPMTLDLSGLAEDDFIFISDISYGERVGTRREFTVALERGASVDIEWGSHGRRKTVTLLPGRGPTRIRLSDTRSVPER